MTFTKERQTYTVPTCDCYDKIRIEETRKREEEERIERINKQIPPRYKGSDFSTFKPKNSKQSRALTLMTGEMAMESYFICGDYGSGKTHLLYSQYRYCSIHAKYSCYVRSTKELIHELNEQEMGVSYSQILGSIRDRKMHLFWDDADKFKATDFKLEALFDLIDKIYRYMHKLTITSNSNLSELQEKLSPAIVRRIDDICTKIEI